MDTLEFTKKLLDLLNNDEKEKVIKIAASKGFSVPNFKNPWKAPIQLVKIAMEQKGKKSKLSFYLIFDAIMNLRVDDEKKNPVPSLAFKWNKGNEEERRQILEIVETLENNSSFISNYNIDKEKLQENNTMDEATPQNEIITKLEKQIEAVKEKNKKLQDDLQNKKIQLDNSEKKIIQMEKKYNKMEKKYNKLDKDFRSVVANCKAYKLEIGELHNKLSNQKDLYNRCLQENEELKRCKCLLPKRICFIKNIKEQDIKKLYENGFELKSEWTDLLKNEIDGIDYVQSWIVHKGFNYKEIIEIKDFFHKKEIKIEEFLNINTLMRKLEGEL